MKWFHIISTKASASQHDPRPPINLIARNGNGQDELTCVLRHPAIRRSFDGDKIIPPTTEGVNTHERETIVKIGRLLCCTQWLIVTAQEMCTREQRESIKLSLIPFAFAASCLFTGSSFQVRFKKGIVLNVITASPRRCPGIVLNLKIFLNIQRLFFIPFYGYAPVLEDCTTVPVGCPGCFGPATGRKQI